jgi:ribosomal protein L27
VFFYRPGQVIGKTFTIDGQSSSGRDRLSVGGFDEQAVAATQFLFQQPDRIMHTGAAQTVGADQFAWWAGVMRSGRISKRST